MSLNEIIPIGLIINELFTNSVKYAFKEIDKPKVIIVLKKVKNSISLTYHDNGIGCNCDKNEHLGLKLVKLNVKQLKGNLKIKHKKGLTYQIKYNRGNDV